MYVYCRSDGLSLLPKTHKAASVGISHNLLVYVGNRVVLACINHLPTDLWIPGSILRNDETFPISTNKEKIQGFVNH